MLVPLRKAALSFLPVHTDSAPLPAALRRAAAPRVGFRDFLVARLDAARRAADVRPDPVAQSEARLCAELLAGLSDDGDNAGAEDALERTTACQSDSDGRRAAANLRAGWRIIAGPPSRAISARLSASA